LTGLGRLQLQLGAIGIGRARTPPAAMADRLLDASGATGAEAERIRAAIADPAGWLDEQIEAAIGAEADGPRDGALGIPFRLADGRAVRLVAVGLEAGAITVTFEGRTED
jgi:hypothetical protein